MIGHHARGHLTPRAVQRRQLVDGQCGERTEYGTDMRALGRGKGCELARQDDAALEGFHYHRDDEGDCGRVLKACHSAGEIEEEE